MFTRVTQPHLAARPLIPWILALTILFASSAFAQDEPAPDQQAPPTSDAMRLIELNRGIQAFIIGDKAGAKAIFEQILTQDPENAACLYYMGLIYMEEGLRLSSSDSQAAQQKFDQARDSLEHVTRTADPTVTPVEAGLLLGIAQLAADNMQDPDMVLKLAQSAHDTLKRYIETVETGKNDRYGHFYLGVACYRLGDTYAREDQYSHAKQYFDEASRAFDTALKLAEMDRQHETAAPGTTRGLDEHEFDEFKLRYTYYKGLVALQRRNNSQAREYLEYVRDNQKGAIGQHATTILETMDQIEAIAPTPMTFESPIGRLDVQGNISFGVNYDTNVILLGDDTALPLNIGQQHDFRFETEANFYISRYIDKTEAPVGESLSIGIGGGTAHGWHPDIHEFDLHQYTGRAFVQWQPLKDSYFGVEYEYSYTDLGNDPFISSHRITPVFSHIWRRPDSRDELGRTDIWYNFDDRDYREEISDRRLNRDGFYHAYGIRHIFNIRKAADLWASYYAEREQERLLFGEEWLNFSLGYVYRDERTDGTEFDLAGHSILSGIGVPLPWRLMFEIEGIFTWEDYSAPSVFDYRRNERSDFVQQYIFGLTRTFVARGECAALPTLVVRLRAGVSWTMRNSNIWNRLSEDIYQYDRAVYGLQLNFNF